jgi:hypothetical protein
MKNLIQAEVVTRLPGMAGSGDERQRWTPRGEDQPALIG